MSAKDMKEKMEPIELSGLEASYLAGMIDHTNLKQTATKADIESLCDEAISHGFGAVCVAPRWVSFVRDKIANTKGDVKKPKICTVIGFPHGNITTEDKIFEAANAIENGASEIDMVISIGDLLSGDDELTKNDISAVVKAAHLKNSIIKVIIEIAYLNDDQITEVCKISREAGADFVKTSTGFATGAGIKVSGATFDAVKLMRETVGNDVGVKASGGISSWENAKSMIGAGANRLGCSSSINIISGFNSVFNK